MNLSLTEINTGELEQWAASSLLFIISYNMLHLFPVSSKTWWSGESWRPQLYTASSNTTGKDHDLLLTHILNVSSSPMEFFAKKITIDFHKVVSICCLILTILTLLQELPANTVVSVSNYHWPKNTFLYKNVPLKPKILCCNLVYPFTFKSLPIFRGELHQLYALQRGGDICLSKVCCWVNGWGLYVCS